jgi:VIT1/CCC1 family predicted Fe2+/Mn2+ transporter
MTVDRATSARFPRILDPMDRISEVLFGLIMALTFTLTFAVATADNMAVRTMLFAALGCNLAWGIIDGGVYLLARLNSQGRAILRWRAVRDEPDAGTAQRLVADALPPLLASIAEPDQLEALRQKVLRLPEPARPRLTKNDLLGAVGIFLLSFLSTFPIVIPFLFIGDARLALRVSNAVAIAMLFLCGFFFGRYAGIQPVAMGVVMVALGCALVVVAIALGG